MCGKSSEQKIKKQSVKVVKTAVPEVTLYNTLIPIFVFSRFSRKRLKQFNMQYIIRYPCGRKRKNNSL